MEGGLVRARTAAEIVLGQLTSSQSSMPHCPRSSSFDARREVLVNVSRIQEIKPYFKSGFRLVMADASATEIIREPSVQARPLRERLPGL